METVEAAAVCHGYVEVFNLVFDCVYLMICRLIVDLGSRRKRFAQKVEEWREL
jgi:hypothetical protein